MCQECEERLVYDKAGTPKLLANLSNQDHIAWVRHGKKLRVLPRPSLLFDAWWGKLHVYLWQPATWGHTLVAVASLWPISIVPHLQRELKYASYMQHWWVAGCAWPRSLVPVLGRPHHHQICQIPPDPERLAMEGKSNSRKQNFAGFLFCFFF